jgi:serine/threonine protein kinase
MALLSPIETDPAFNKYEFIEVCGVGGMGVVYKARQTILDKIVAIKMLHSGLLSPETFRRFQIEGKSASMLEHPYIIKVHDLGVSASGPYMILEYVKGRTLAQVLQSEGPLSVERFLHVSIQVCSALEHAHNRGVFHRDLKPSNIMLTRSFNNEEEIRIMDFGIAKLIGESEKESVVDKLTRTGEAIGSPAYMSPEQAQGGNIDARSDLYSVGCVMFEALTGAPPFNKTTALETMMAHISEPPMTMTQSVLSTTKFDESLETIVARLLQKDPARRYQSMQELQNHLIGVREGKGLGQFVYKQGGNNTRLIAVSCIGGAAVACIIFMLVLLIGKPFQSRQIHVGLLHAKTAPASNLIDLPSPIMASIANNNKEMTLGAEGFTVDEDLAPLVNDKTVEKISLRKANISGLGLKYLAKIPTLKELNLSNSSVHTLENLSDAKSLETLNLDDTLIGDYQVDQIKNLRLKSLDLSNTSVSTLGGLRDMKSLTSLKLNLDKHLNSQSMSVIGRLNNLEQLELSCTPITDADLVDIAQLPKLQSLRLDACRNLSDRAVNKLKEKLPVDCVLVYEFGHRPSEPESAAVQTLIDEKSKETEEKAGLLKYKALRLWQNHHYKDALALYNQVLPTFQSAQKKTTSDWSELADCLRMIGNCHFLMQQMEPAIPNYEKATAMLEKHPDSNIYDQLPYWYYELGILYDSTNRKKQGLAAHLRSNDLFSANQPIYTQPDSAPVCQSQDDEWQRNKALNLFSLYTDSVLNRPTAANDEHLRSLLQTALDISAKDPTMKNSLLTASYYHAIGDLFTIEAQRTTDATLREHDYTQALENYEHSRDIAVFNRQDPHVPDHLTIALIGVGSVDIALKHYAPAEAIFKDMLAHHTDKSSRATALRNLIAICHFEHRQAEMKSYQTQLAQIDKK